MFVSGATALVYESLWMRSFTLVFGNTTDAVTLVLATFMGGLALGSLAAARLRVTDALAAYAKVELGIAAAALLSLALLRALPGLYGRLFAGGGAGGGLEAAARAVGACAILLPATCLIGATVPLLVERLTRLRRQFHPSFGRLYLTNTLGGAAGVFAGGFVLLPALGVTRTFAVCALANATVGVVAWRWARGQERPSAPPSPAIGSAAGRPVAGESPAAGVPSHLFAALAVVSGACSFGLEVLWTRSYALVIGSSVYAFNVMLLSFLLGIVLGTAVYERLWTRITEPLRLAGLLSWAAGALVLASAVVVGWLPAVHLAVLKQVPVSFAAHQAAAFALCFMTMIPVTTLFGFSFPLLAHLVRGQAESPRTATGLVYAWNTAGAIAGALATGFLLVSTLGLQRSYGVVAAVALVVGTWAVAHAGAWPRVHRAVAFAAVTLAGAALGTWFRPWDPLVMTAGVYKYGTEWRDRPGFGLALGSELAADRTLLFYEEGREAVVAVTERVGSKRRFLSVNGKTDAGNGPEDVLTQKYIAHVPLLLHPSPSRALVIGWGAGATAASAALYPLARLECVEIEPATYRAAPLFGDLNAAVLTDPRFHLVFRDGRNHLLASPERWDVIVSEPSNPWISGISNLFTRDFYEIVLGRLAPGGVFGQWFHYYNLEARDVRVEIRTFLDVFPHAALWLVPPITGEGGGSLTADMLLVGSSAPLALDFARVQQLFRAPAIGGDIRSTGVLPDELSLVATHAMARDDMTRFVEADPAAGSLPLNTDDFPYVEFQAPRGNVAPREKVVRDALDLYAVLSDGGREVTPPVAGWPPLTGSGSERAAAYLELAARYTTAAMWSRALRTLDAAVALDPASAQAHAQLGELLITRGRVAEAEPRLQKALALDPDLERPYELLGTLYLDRGDTAKAENLDRELIRRRPSAAPAYLRLASIVARRAEWAEARDLLRKAREIDPNLAIDARLVQFLEQKARPPASNPAVRR